MKITPRMYVTVFFIIVLAGLFIIGRPLLAINYNGLLHGKGTVRNPHLNPTPTPTPGGPSPTPTPTPTPNPIPHGTKGFSVSSRNPGPKMGRGTIDPYDPLVGAAQSISISITDTAPVTTVNLMLKTDHAAHTYPMSLISGTNLNGVWQATWTAYDSYTYIYKVILQADSANGTNSFEMTLR